ncbi:MAG TPA: ElyC/SanA/YdcF family protein [Flavobacteriales bacterium]|mgnify:FL=1|nr:ElyC/SanA/YdcF family protein [Flavobacteriales bacterium]HPH82337.1 ElyC/SanA/YdcF family protein [Flavobacteriales bacterium]
MLRRRWFRRTLLFLFLALLLTGGVVYWSNYWIDEESDSWIFTDTQEMPHTKVGLLLGTSKYNRSGNPNLFFRYRIDAAVELYNSHKVDYLLVSGDNRTLTYNEPRDMRRALIARGIPDSVIYLDYAGIRTFDSVIRCYRVFGQTSFTIISQEFHVERALFIARHYGLSAVGFAARSVPNVYSLTTVFREYLARLKAVLDVYILPTKPRFLGDPVQVGK